MDVSVIARLKQKNSCAPQRQFCVIPFSISLSASFKKPSVKDLVTQEYHRVYAEEQGCLKESNSLKPMATASDDDDISVYCGADMDAISKSGSNKGSLLSRLSNKLKPNTPDQLSLLDNNEESDLGDGIQNTSI